MWSRKIYLAKVFQCPQKASRRYVFQCMHERYRQRGRDREGREKRVRQGRRWDELCVCEREKERRSQVTCIGSTVFTIYLMKELRNPYPNIFFPA